MSSIISFHIVPNAVSNGGQINLNTTVSENGTVNFEIKNTSAVKFGNGQSSIGHEVSIGNNNLQTTLHGAPGLVNVHASFIDEAGQEKTYVVNLN